MFSLKYKATQSSYGSNFVFGVLPNRKDALDSLNVNVHVTNHEAKNVSAIIFPPANGDPVEQVITPHETWVYVSDDDPVFSPMERNKGFRVTTTAGETIGVTISLHDSVGDGAYRVLPCRSYSTVQQYEYFVPYGNEITTILLVADQNGTSMSLASPLSLSIPADLSPSGSNVSLSAVNITLHDRQTFLLMTDSTESSFIKINSNKPIALFFGHPDSIAQGLFPSSDFMGGQMPPTVTWGKTFVFGTFVANPALVIFIAASNNSTLEYVCDNLPSTTVTLGEGQTQTIEVAASSYCTAISSSPTAAVISSLLHPGAFDGDRSLTVLSPVEQYLESVTFPPIANFLPIPCTGESDDCVLVVISATAGDSFNATQVLVDNTSLSEDVWTPAQLPNGTTLGYVAYQQLNESVHTIRSTSSETRIGVVVYRIFFLQALSFSAGTNLSPLHGMSASLYTLRSLLSVPTYLFTFSKK